MELDDLAVRAGFDNAELGRLVNRNRNRRNGNAGTGFQVLTNHLAGVHVIDVIRTEHADDVWPLVADQVEVLIDRIGGPAKPLRTPAHLRWHRRDVVTEQRAEPPGLADVAVEAMTFVLRQHHDLQVAGVGEVRQDEVDDSIAATKRHRWLGAIGGKRRQTAALATSENNDQDSWICHSCVR